MKASRVFWLVTVMAATLTACSSDDPPSGPRLHAITGHVRLTGYLVARDGGYAGTRVMGDADGIPVELLRGGTVIARTTTVHGTYTFSDLPPSDDYVARSRVIGDIGDQTVALTIATYDVAAADTIRLASRGDLFPVPNPFVDSTQVYFAVLDTTRVDMNIVDVGGQTIKSLLSLPLQPGYQAVFWNGRDQAGRVVTGSLFWVTYVSGSDVRAALLFKQPAIP
jgi:hypothetical protein